MQLRLKSVRINKSKKRHLFIKFICIYFLIIYKMRNTKKQAFTLVELIVVITILAILGTIAFISLQGYSQDAKNSKVTSDVSSLAQKVNIKTTEANGSTLAELLKANSTVSANNSAAGTWAWIAISASNYKVGNLDFAELGEDRNKFSDEATGKDYLYAYLAEGRTALYSVAGQIKDAAGNYTAVVKWNYYTTATTDNPGLISASGASNTGVIDNEALWAGNTLY